MVGYFRKHVFRAISFLHYSKYTTRYTVSTGFMFGQLAYIQMLCWYGQGTKEHYSSQAFRPVTIGVRKLSQYRKKYCFRSAVFQISGRVRLWNSLSRGEDSELQYLVQAPHKTNPYQIFFYIQIFPCVNCIAVSVSFTRTSLGTCHAQLKKKHEKKGTKTSILIYWQED